MQLGYDENGVTKGRKLKALCDIDALKDINSAISVVASAGKVGVIGYCWGGSLSWRTACENSKISASITYYGGDIPRLKNYKPKCKVLSHFGELDKGIPIETVNLFKEVEDKLVEETNYILELDQSREIVDKCKHIPNSVSYTHLTLPTNREV